MVNCQVSLNECVTALLDTLSHLRKAYLVTVTSYVVNSTKTAVKMEDLRRSCLFPPCLVIIVTTELFDAAIHCGELLFSG